MLRKSILRLIAAGVLIFGNSAGAQSDDHPGEQTVQSQLIGNWKLVALEDLVDGQWVQSFGPHPKGYFAFDAKGRVSVQFARDPSLAPFAGDSPTPGEALEAYNSYLAYFGAYTVDEAAGTFTTVVEGAPNPSLVGTKQVRRFVIDGQRMVVGDQVTYRRLFEKS